MKLTACLLMITQMGFIDNGIYKQITIYKTNNYEQITKRQKRGIQAKSFIFIGKVLLTYRAEFTIDTQYYFERSKAVIEDNRQAFLIAARLRFKL